ncbi:MAG: cytochrome c [Dongiaceae bacterium]
MMRLLSMRAIASFALAFSAALVGDASIVRADGLVDRGEYLATIMDCAGCHTGGVLAGKPDPARHLSGSEVGFQLPGLGVFYPPNLTPDVETGLGRWSKDEILEAVRHGLRPDGRELAPIMPWRSYGALNDEDAAALVAYLKSLPPISFKAPGPFGESETPTGPYLTVVVPE